MLRVHKEGKRAAIGAGLRATDPDTDIVIVLDSDTVWAPGALREMLRPFADPRVGGGTPDAAVPIAAAIFLDVFNIFLIGAELFGGRRE